MDQYQEVRAVWWAEGLTRALGSLEDLSRFKPHEIDALRKVAEKLKPVLWCYSDDPDEAKP